MLALSFIGLLAAAALGSMIVPAIALAAVVCMFGLEQWGQASGSGLAVHAAFTNIAVGVIVLIAFTSSLLRGQRPLSGLPANYWVVVGLFAYAFVSLMWTPNPDQAISLWQSAYLYLFTMVFVPPLLCVQPRDYLIGLRALIVGGGAVCAMLLFFGHWGYRGLVTNAALFGLETNPLAMASMAGQVALTAFLVPLSKSRLIRWSALLVIAPLCIALVVRTGSRGQLVAVLLGLAVAWPFARGGALALRMLLAPALVALLGLIAYASLDYFGGDSARWNDAGLATSDVEGRLSMAMVLLGKLGESPLTVLFGLGSSASYHLFGIYPHVVTLEILGEEGIFGLALFGLAIGSCALAALRMPGMSMTKETRATAAALIGGAVFHLVVSFKQGSLLQSELLFLHLILVPKLVLAAREEQAPAPVPVIEQPVPFANLMRA